MQTRDNIMKHKRILFLLSLSSMEDWISPSDTLINIKQKKTSGELRPLAITVLFPNLKNSSYTWFIAMKKSTLGRLYLFHSCSFAY